MNDSQPYLDHAHPLVRDIVTTFKVSPEFVSSYFGGQRGLRAEQYGSWSELAANLDPMQFMYVEFALTCVLRATDVADLLTRHIASLPDSRDSHSGQESGAATEAQLPSSAPTVSTMPRRYLDVGCGYGGFVREFALRGFHATGVEIQDHLAVLSRANCADIDGRAEIVCRDFLAGDEEIGAPYDVITCNDVIEHVADPGDAIGRMARMLKLGGVLFLEIPNRDCVESVKSDGHFQMFGLSTLERSAAARYLQSAAGRDEYLREMGELYQLDFYLAALRNAGLQPQVHQRHVVGSLPTIPELMAGFSASHSTWQHAVRPRLDFHLARHIDEMVADYQARLWQCCSNAFRTGDALEFELKYLNSFWSVIATRVAR